jgi:phosphatidylinositol-3,4,5-trisphosphate 3-phosphatase/dual-specificity protein phosphatase PTEN
MGFPSSDMEGLYRNPIGEVYRFFELRHKDNYKLYNLCAERDYDHSKFHGRVSRYPFEDHNAPPINLIVQCCADIHQWLAEDENHVVGINCKAGKGRTGLIICCYLMHSKVVLDSDEAMLYYGSRRTKDGKGVTIASQQRYVRYYNQVLNMGGTPPEPRLLMLKSVRLHTIPDFSGDPYIIIISQNQQVHKSTPASVTKKAATHDMEVGHPVHGDVKIQFCVKKGRNHQNTCHFWFSTAFVPADTNRIEMQKSEIDVANKDKKNAHFKADFRIEAFFEVIDVAKPEGGTKKEKKNKKSGTESPVASSSAAASPSPKDSPKGDRKGKKGTSATPEPAAAAATEPVAESSSASDVSVPAASGSASASAAASTTSPAATEEAAVAPAVKPKKGVAIASDAKPEEEGEDKKPAEFAQRRKRAQSFYDTSSSDEGLSSSELEEKQMDAYFATEEDEEDDVAGPVVTGTPSGTRRTPSPSLDQAASTSSAPTSPKSNGGDANGHASSEAPAVTSPDGKKDKKADKKDKKDKKADKLDKTPSSPTLDKKDKKSTPRKEKK